MKGSVRAMGVQEVRLHPKGAFHIGERGIGYEGASEFAPADTLFSALCAGWVLLYGEDALMNELLANNEPNWTPPFIISSAFPFIGSVRFYPKPLAPSPENRIRWKEVKWVSEGVLRSWLKGESFANRELQTLHDETVVLLADEREQICKDFGLRSLEGIRFWAVQRVPRVVLDTITHASSLFHFGRLIFHDGCGLFFLVRFLRDDIAEKFGAVVRLLGDEGIGGDRTTGSGNFCPKFSDAVPDFCQPQKSQWFVNLSPLFPKPEETSSLFADGCNYRLTVRSGWMGGVLPFPVRRKIVRMISEGSVLCGSAERIWGKIVNVTPAGAHHCVYRWGYAFPVACGVRLS